MFIYIIKYWLANCKIFAFRFVFHLVMATFASRNGKNSFVIWYLDIRLVVKTWHISNFLK